MPRYEQFRTWILCQLILQSLPNNEDLSHKSLTQKLAILLGITAPKRSSEVNLLDLHFMIRILTKGAGFQLPCID